MQSVQSKYPKTVNPQKQKRGTVCGNIIHYYPMCSVY